MLKGFAISIPVLAFFLYYLSEGIYWDGLFKIGLKPWTGPLARLATEYGFIYLGILVWVYFVLMLLNRVVWLRQACRVIMTAILLLPLLVVLHFSREAYHDFLWGTHHWLLWLLVGMLTYWVWKLAGYSMLLPERYFWRKRTPKRSARTNAPKAPRA